MGLAQHLDTGSQPHMHRRSGDCIQQGFSHLVALNLTDELHAFTCTDRAIQTFLAGA